MRIRLALMLTLAVGPGGIAAGQQPREQTDSAFAASCRVAAAALRNPTTAPGWVRGNIAQCTEAGPPAIAAVWELVPANDDTLLNELRHWSRTLHDQRILDATLTAAGDAGREPVIRFVALQVLLSYVDQRYWVRLESLTSGVGSPTDLYGREGTDAPEIAHATHQVIRSGPIPPGSDAAERVVALLRRLALAEADPLAWAARGLWLRLVDRKPDLGITDARALTLAAVCGDRYQIVNPLPISLGVELVGGHGPSRVRVPAADTLTVTRPRASEGLTLRYGGRDVVTVARAGQACR